MRNILCICSLALLLGACSSDKTSNTTPTATTPDSTAAVAQPAPDTTDFKVAFDQFFDALQTADATAFNKFIHPKYGLWVIEQPGAMPSMTQVFQIQKFDREYQDRSFFTIAEDVQECELQEEQFPTFDCADVNYEAGKSGYSKDGCFVGGAAKFRESGYWDYASLTKEQVQAIQNTLPLVQKTVLHTKSSFEFHFGYVDGHWRLLFTKITYPCSA